MVKINSLNSKDFDNCTLGEFLKTNNMSNMQNVNAAAHSIEDTDMMAKTLSQQPI